MTRAGIIGAAGYTAGELLRILLNHPEVEVAFAQSSSHAGEPVWTAHEDLYGLTSLEFSEKADPSDADVIFLCSGHGKSRPYVESLPAGYKGAIIDLSNDFRLKEDAGDFVYGLPEAYRDKIRGARHIANPGCFATAIQLSLLPMASKLPACVNVTGVTGSTGAGQNPSATTHFSWRSGNMSVYKAFTHQHLGEVCQTLGDFGWDHAAGAATTEDGSGLAFVPVRGDFPRGIMVSTYFDSDLPEDEVRGIYEDFYKDAPFTSVAPFSIDMKMVVGTNRCILSVRKYGRKVHVVSIIDNLVKGASGQAVQNMNLVFGFPEDEGLSLKSIRF